MDELLQNRIPHAPQMGLFVIPEIPEDRLTNALADYAHHVSADEVVALYDATLSGNAKDGAVFAVDRFIFQNTDLEQPQTVRYRDLEGIELKHRWLGIAGKKIDLQIRRGRTSFELTMDFSGQPEAADYVAHFLEAALHYEPQTKEADPGEPTTDVEAVRRALGRLRRDNKLTDEDYHRLLSALD